MLVVFAGIVFFGSILNASLVSLAERQREVATLRVLGYGPWQIGSLLSARKHDHHRARHAPGHAAGLPADRGHRRAYASDMFRMPVVASTGLWMVTMAFAVVFGLLTHLVVQRAISGMDWLDALKTQE